MKNKILLVNTEKEFTKKITGLLKEKHYRVLHSEDYKAGFNTVKQKSPDVIVVDTTQAYREKSGGGLRSILQDCRIKGVPIILMLPPDFTGTFPGNIEETLDTIPLNTLIEKDADIKAIVQHIDLLVEQGGEKHRQIVRDIAELTDKWKERRGNLIMILHEIQNRHSYVPRSVTFVLSEALDVPVARIYEVLTFYNYFRVKAPGKHIISVCTGTACYLKGAGQIVEEIKSLLNIEEGQASADNLFQLEMVRCLGCCGLAPVMTIDNRVYGHVDKNDIAGILGEYTKKGEPQNA